MAENEIGPYEKKTKRKKRFLKGPSRLFPSIDNNKKNRMDHFNLRPIKHVNAIFGCLML